MAKKTNTTHDSITIINAKKKELAIFSIFTFSVLIILLIFAVRPMLVTIVRINSELSRKQEVNRQIEDRVSALESLRTQYVDFEDELEDLTLVFPNNWDFSLFVSNIEELCNENNFRLESIRLEEFRHYDDEADELSFEKLAPWTSSITVIGREENLIHLFNDLESLPMYTTIDGLSYQMDFEYWEEDEDHGLVEYQIVLRLYYIDDPAFYNLFNF